VETIARIIALAVGITVIVALSLSPGDEMRSIIHMSVRGSGVLWSKAIILGTLGIAYLAGMLLILFGFGIIARYRTPIERLLVSFALGVGMMLLLAVAAALSRWLWNAQDLSFAVLCLWALLVCLGVLVLRSFGPPLVRQMLTPRRAA
jgi:hypothetical protein